MPSIEEAAPETDAVASVDDWPAPAFVDLRGGTPKSVDAPLRAIQLVLAGGVARRVGESVTLTLVSASEATVAVCVTGPEQGVIWRGEVAGGRTELSRAGHPQSFAFAAPGTYRFAVGTTDLDHCSKPVHVVEVEVSG